MASTQKKKEKSLVVFFLKGKSGCCNKLCRRVHHKSKKTVTILAHPKIRDSQKDAAKRANQRDIFRFNTYTNSHSHTLYYIQLLTCYYAPVVRMEITYASPSAPNLADSGDSNSNSSMATTLTRPVKIIPLLHPNTASSSSSSSSSSGSGSFLSALFSKWKTKVRRMSWHNWIELFLPCYRWIRTYKWREYLQVDLMSGTTVGVMLVPQVILLSLSLKSITATKISVILVSVWMVRKWTKRTEERISYSIYSTKLDSCFMIIYSFIFSLR